MGDRSNIVIRDSYDGPVILYSHWWGRDLFTAAQTALDSDIARRRWDDTSYLRRIVFQSILDRDGLSETGFGIGTKIGDNEHPVLVIDTESRRVDFVDEGHALDPVHSGDGWNFEEFCQMDLTYYNL